MTTSGYHLDLRTFSLAKLKSHLKTTRLLPSQRVLQEKIDARFSRLEQNGIENLAQLQKALKTKSDVQNFAQATNLPIDFLTILRREVNSNQPKPIPLKDIPGVNPDVVRILYEMGVKNTEQLFPNVLTPEDRSGFAKRIQVEHEDILELTKLTDVARTKWVGPKFARLLVETEYDTVEKIANSNPEELYLALVRVNEERNIYRGKFGKEDMGLWINTVQDVPQVIQY